jgi:Kdo2-lipid IVA lauroyltransferase/acyltransferase
MSSFFNLIFNFASFLPLGALHRAGSFIGWVSYLTSPAYAKRVRENLALAFGDGAESSKIRRASLAEAGKSITEAPWIWLRPLRQVTQMVRECHGWEHVEEAQRDGRGIIFLTPHLGCFEISALYAAERLPMTVLYRPPRIHWLEDVMKKGRERAKLKLARTDIGGVRLLFKALKRKEAIGLLPDQVPGMGEGEWADFFGRPAYTMSLVARLAESSNAQMLMAYAERLPRSEGYIIRIKPLEFTGSDTTRQLNAALEETVRACPEQYLWGYNRYKTPAGVELPGAQ